MTTASVDSLPPDDRAVVERFDAAGQGHVFRFLDRLDEPARRGLLDQAASIDLDLVDELARLAASPPQPVGGTLEPAEVLRAAETDPERLSRACREGEALIREGRVAVLLVAGGQATRLGHPGPKGTFPIGPVTERTLFEWFGARLQALGERFGRPLPLYVMTSEATHDDTETFLESRAHVGLDPDDVRLFRQGMVPALDSDGRLLLETPGRIFLGPNGHGGVFDALATSGSLDDMADRGVEEIYYFQVDNVLARIADPLFLGLHRAAGADMSSKVVEKAEPSEKVGVVARRDGRLGVVEYSELPRNLMDARGDDGRLVFGAGSIAIHALSVDFARRMAADDLPYHVARKAVPCVDADGRTVRPTEANGRKFERFVFDALPHAKASVTLEVVREREFAPVKNAEGADSPATARALLTAEFRRWFEEAGLDVPAFDRPGIEVGLEIDPRFALDASGLRARVAEGGAG